MPPHEYRSLYPMKKVCIACTCRKINNTNRSKLTFWSILREHKICMSHSSLYIFKYLELKHKDKNLVETSAGKCYSCWQQLHVSSTVSTATSLLSTSTTPKSRNLSTTLIDPCWLNLSLEFSPILQVIKICEIRPRDARQNWGHYGTILNLLIQPCRGRVLLVSDNL